MPVRPGQIPTARAKAAVIEMLSKGVVVETAMRAVDRTPKTYENWRAQDREFKRLIDEVRAVRSDAKRRGVANSHLNLSFAEWRQQYLHQETYVHQQMWVDLLEGRQPKIIPGTDFYPADERRLIINVPPFHAKSQTITIEYVVFRICMNPNVRIIIVSKRQDQAAKFLYAIKQRLTSTQWAALQTAYAPDGGFRPAHGSGKWGANSFYVSSDDRDQKDPTVEAIGLGSQIYGSRADLILLDDCIVLANANEYDRQITWLESEVESRVRDGIIALIGTRLAPKDLYSELLNGERYIAGSTPWSYLRQPAVLSYAGDPKDWKTLWPTSTAPLETGQKADAKGLYSAWPGEKMAQVRNRKPPRVWSLVYQQQDVADDAVFDPKCVMGSTERRRKPGVLRAGPIGHPRNGMEGQYVIASMDPAMTGETFTLVGAVDRLDKKRRIMNAWVQASPTPQYIRDLIKSVTVEFSVNEWVIEQNAFQLFLVYDEEIQAFCRERGVKITPHYTSRNKMDPDFGVASVAPLFGNLRGVNDGSGRKEHDGHNLIELPDPDLSEAIKSLIEQLTTWQPGKQGKVLKQDGPMALWFFELRAREVLGVGKRRQSAFMENRYLTNADKGRRYVIPADRRLVTVE